MDEEKKEQEQNEVDRLKKEIARLQRENDKLQREVSFLRVTSPKNRLPEDYIDCNLDVMSNRIVTEKARVNEKGEKEPEKVREPKIDSDLAKRLQKEKIFAGYHSDVFHGRVWWDREGKAYKCEIWESGFGYRQTLQGTLEEIMKETQEKYGKT